MADKEPQLPLRTNGLNMVKDVALATDQLLIPSYATPSLGEWADDPGQSFGLNETNKRLTVRGEGEWLEFPSIEEVNTSFQNKQNLITLTTNGTGAASFDQPAGALNIPTPTGGGVTTMTAIGATPNANGATISGSNLTLQPASASFGGILTTGNQTLAGVKIFNSDILVQGITVGRGPFSSGINTVLGNSALSSTTSGTENVAVGYQALLSNTGGFRNVAVGSQALKSNLGAGQNTAIGYLALELFAGTGGGNTGIGAQALNKTTGDYNTGVGDGALVFNTIGSFNTAIGNSSGTSYGVGDLNNSTAIGYNAKVDVSNKIQLGDTNVTLVNTSGAYKASQYKLSDLNTAPASATDTGEKGEIRVTADYIYVCIAANVWVRAALATW